MTRNARVETLRKLREGPIEAAPTHAALDAELCERARQTRDARFDGRFFIGVLTTGVYCRPICGVRPPKPENVRFFASAAAAAEAGFRPCLRCRPESAPGTSAWRGTAATVSRALRLIQEGALDGSEVAALAARLGIGSRQLTRLFVRHLGASPGQVAQTRRLQLAKKLLDETRLPVTEIAGAAGFGSVRRFNEAMRACYGRPPSALRKGRAGASPGDRLELRVAFRPPFDWPALRDFLALRAVPGVERVEGDRYERTLSVDGRLGRLAARAVPGSHHIALALELPDAAAALVRVLARVRRLFDLDAAPATIEGDLGRDAELALQLAKRPGLRVPGAFDGFELAVRAILGQLVSVAAARTLAARIAARFGRRVPGASGEAGVWLAFPDAHTLADADLRAIGLPETRAAAIRELARRVADGTLDLESPRALDGFVAELRALPGIGEWTAHYVALRALGEPDAFPASDLGLLRGAALCLGSGERFTPARLTRRAEAWRPWRGYAAMHLWRAYAEAAPSGRRPRTV